MARSSSAQSPAKILHPVMSASQLLGLVLLVASGLGSGEDGAAMDQIQRISEINRKRFSSTRESVINQIK